MANFEVFCWVISSSIHILFLKSGLATQYLVKALIFSGFSFEKKKKTISTYIIITSLYTYTTLSYLENWPAAPPPH